MKIINKITMLLLLLISSPCYSDSDSLGYAENGAYFGFGFGKSTYDVGLSEVLWIIDDGSIISASLDDSDSSLSFFLGKKINSNIAIEGGYMDLGAVNLDAVSDGTGFIYFPGPVNLELETSGLFFNMKVEAVMSAAASLYGKIGLVLWDVDVSLSDSISSASVSDDGSDIFFGVGALFDINENISLYIDYSLYDFDDLELDNISFGLKFGVN